MPDITISLTAPQATRVGAALGAAMRLVDGNGDPRSATLDEARDFLRQQMIDVVRAQERRAAEKAISDQAFTKFGARLFKKASMPSFWSAVANRL